MKTIIAATVVMALLASSPCSAQESGPPPDEPFPVILKVGEIFKVCRSGQMVCPAIGPICDHPDVAAPFDTTDGLGFMAVAPGTTLCSAANPSGMRRVFRIKVRQPETR